MRWIVMLFWVMVYSTMSLNAQKMEREFRIDQTEFPEEALEFLNQLDLPLKKVKWFKEVQEHRTSFEAKIKVEKFLYSIEFDSLGRLEDIEKMVKFNRLPPDIQSVLKQSLRAQLGSYKIVKTQIQFTELRSEKVVLTELSVQNSSIKYEIELFTKRDASKRLMEYLLSNRGEILSSHEVIVRSSENLMY